MRYPIFASMFLIACVGVQNPDTPCEEPDACVPAKIDCVGKCGDIVDNCGRTVACGGCELPYVCGAQDLQWYQPEANRCGLDCQVMKPVPHDRCPTFFPVSYVCPYSPEIATLMVDKWTYACTLLPPVEGMDVQKQLRFCCGL